MPNSDPLFDGPDTTGFVGEPELGAEVALDEVGGEVPCFSASFLSICSRSSLFFRSVNSDVNKLEIENELKQVVIVL